MFVLSPDTIIRMIQVLAENVKTQIVGGVTMVFAFLKINIEMEYLTVRTGVTKNQVPIVHNFYTLRLSVSNSVEF